MKTIEHNKLVRDNIPAIITANGDKCETLKVKDAGSLKILLQCKLIEETAEFIESKEKEEIADIVEVAYALANAYGVSSDEIDTIRKQKKEKLGGFNGAVYLVRTENN